MAQALAGQCFTNRLFSASGQTGATVQSLCESRLRLWLDAVERNGLAEFNSAAYYPIDLLGLLVLHDYGADADLKRRSAHLLDEIFAMIAQYTLGGTPAGAQVRQGGGCVWHCADNKVALVIRVGCINRFDDVSDFQHDCQAHTPDFDIDRNAVRTRFDGTSLALQYDGSLVVDEQEQVEQSDSVWPWIFRKW